MALVGVRAGLQRDVIRHKDRETWREEFQQPRPLFGRQLPSGDRVLSHDGTNEESAAWCRRKVEQTRDDV
jgi:hypothetical protein